MLFLSGDLVVASYLKDILEVFEVSQCSEN